MNKKHIAIDHKFVLFMLTGAFLLLLSYFCIFEDEPDIKLGIAIGIFALFFITVPIFLHPLFYVFDSEGVSIHFVLYPKERYLWENVRDIEAGNDTGAHTSLFLDFLFSRVFIIHGKAEGKQRFYMHGNIIRTRRTKRLIEKCRDGTVEGLF